MDRYARRITGRTEEGVRAIGRTPGTDTVIGISGYFSDTNPEANFSGAITGLELAPPPSSAPPFPAPAFTISGLSDDNLFYPDGLSPLVCADYPFAGGVLDSYGVAFDVAGGYICGAVERRCVFRWCASVVRGGRLPWDDPTGTERDGGWGSYLTERSGDP